MIYTSIYKLMDWDIKLLRKQFSGNLVPQKRMLMQPLV